MSDLDVFIEHDIRGNLFRDLRGMQTIEIGFPLVMTACAGIELFGGLLSLATFRATSPGEEYFLWYWNGYLYRTSAAAQKLGSTVYKLARHGIAHGFVLKGPLSVGRNLPAAHLNQDANGYICIDAVQLASDLIRSFNQEVEPILARSSGSPSRDTVSTRFTEMKREYGIQVARILGVRRPVASLVAETAAQSMSAIMQTRKEG